mgnify:FL=1
MKDEILKSYYSNPKDLINYSHNVNIDYYKYDFHLHELFEIYFFISGNVNYFVENKVYHLKYGDLLVMNNHEIHRPSVIYPGSRYERIVIHFEPSLVQAFNPPEMDLLSCFINRPKGENNRISLSRSQVDEILLMFSKIENFQKSMAPDSALLKLVTFIELIIFINNIYISMKNRSTGEISSDIPGKLAEIIDYIDKNLDKDLSLESLERTFYLNKYYLSRQFKKYTGSNIHEYILYKRISKAKALLSEGYRTTDTSIMCGFNDYSNFYRMFKKTVGVSPSDYRKTT